MVRRIAKPITFAGWRDTLLTQMPEARIEFTTDDAGTIDTAAGKDAAGKIVATWALVASYTPGPPIIA